MVKLALRAWDGESWSLQPPLACGGKGEGKMLSPSHCLLHAANGKPTQPLTNGSTQENRLRALSGQHSWADLSRGTSEPRRSKREILYLLSRQLPTVAGGRASPEIMRAGELSLPFTSAALRRAVPAPGWEVLPPLYAPPMKYPLTTGPKSIGQLTMVWNSRTSSEIILPFRSSLSQISCLRNGGLTQ